VAMCGQQCATKFIIVYGDGFDLIFMSSGLGAVIECWSQATTKGEKVITSSIQLL